MKKIIKAFLLIINLIICINVYAKTNYSNTPSFTNDYIKKFKNYQRYIVTETTKYGFDNNNNIFNNSKFKTGGMLNKREFDLSLDDNGNTYLFNGLEYFTMTENGNNVVIIDPTSHNYFSNKSQNYSSGIRVTNYVQNKVEVTGKGTKTNPWMFVEKYNIRYEFDETRIDIVPSTGSVVSGQLYSSTIIPVHGYDYYDNDCGAVKVGNTLTITLDSDVVCHVDTSVAEYTITYDSNGGNACDPDTKKVEYNSRIGTLCSPTRTGYDFDGWYTSADGGTKVNEETLMSGDLLLYAHWINRIPPVCTLKATETTITFDSYSDPNGGTITGWKITTSDVEPTTWDNNVSSLSIAEGTYYGWVKNDAGSIAWCSNNGIINITVANGMYTCTKPATPLYTCSINATPLYTCTKPATKGESNDVTCNTAAKYNNPSKQCSDGYTYTNNTCSASHSCPNGGSPTSSGVCQLSPTTKYNCFTSAPRTELYSYQSVECSKNSNGTYNYGGHLVEGATYCPSEFTVCDANHVGTWREGSCVSDGYSYGSCPAGTQPSGTNCLDYTDRVDCYGWTGTWNTKNVCSSGTYNSSSGKCEYNSTSVYTGTIYCNKYSCSTGNVNGTSCVTTDNLGGCDTSHGWSANPSTPTGYDCTTNYPGTTKDGNKCYKYNQISCPSTSWTSTPSGKYTCLDGGTCDGGNSSTCTIKNQTSTIPGWTCTNEGAYCTTGVKVGSYCFNHVYGVTLDEQGGTGTTPTKIYYHKDTNNYYSDITTKVEITKITNPTRTGYTFGGYYTGTNGSGTQYITNASTGGVISNSLYTQVPSTFQSDKQAKLYAKWTPHSYTLTISQETGTTVTVNRTSTNSGASTGNLSNGDTIYYDDVLKITITPSTGYSIGTHTVNSSTWTSGNNHTVTGNVTVTATASKTPYTITFDKQSGSGGSNSVIVYYGDAMPSATMPSRSGFTFGGYFTSTGGGGTQYYTAAGASARTWDLTSNTTLYAKWTAIGPPEYTYTGTSEMVNQGGGNWYLILKSSGTLTFTDAQSVNFFAVGGGGGGGSAGLKNNVGSYNGGGGGGGGAIRYTTNSYNVTSSLTVTIGGGGSGASTPATSRGSSGSETIVKNGSTTVISAGGGAGGGSANSSTGPGGSGGTSGAGMGTTINGKTGGNGGTTSSNNGVPYKGQNGTSGTYPWGSTGFGNKRYGASGGGGAHSWDEKDAGFEQNDKISIGGYDGGGTGSTTEGGTGSGMTSNGGNAGSNYGAGGGGAAGGWIPSTGTYGKGGNGGSGVVIIRNHR